MTQYNPKTGKGRLFVEYSNIFLKLKAEASGYLSWIRTPADEDQYIDIFWQSEGVPLDTNKIKYYAAKRGLAKLCLNSMWGKLGERNLRIQTTLIFNPKQLYTFLAMPDVEVSSPLFVSDHAVWISWQHAEEMHAPIMKHTNDVITSYVTAGAGIHLYS